jgi:hypothetical protein
MDDDRVIELFAIQVPQFGFDGFVHELQVDVGGGSGLGHGWVLSLVAAI